MARSFDNFPTYDPLVKANTDYMSSIWVDFIATFVETLSGYLTQNGVFIPPLSTEQRDALQNVVNGQVIYNTTLEKFQGRENGAWVNLI